MSQKDGLARLALIVHAGADCDLITQLIAEVFDCRNRLVHSRPARALTIRKPVAQRRILLNPLFDNPIRLDDRTCEIRQRRIQHSVRRHHLEQARRIAHSRLLHRVEIFFQRSEAFQHLRVTRGIATPRDFVFDRNNVDDGVRCRLFAGAENFVVAVRVEIDFTLDHADARAFRARIHCEGCSRNRDQRIAGGHEHVVLLFRGFDNHAAAIEIYRRTAHRLIERELRAILHLDDRAIAETHHGMSILRSANHLAATDLLSDFQLARFCISYEIKRTVGGLHRRLKRTERNVTLNDWPGDQSQTDHQRGGDPPTQYDRTQTILHFLISFAHGGNHSRNTSFARLLQSPATWNAFMRVIDQQKRTCRGKFPAQIRCDKRLKIRAAFDCRAHWSARILRAGRAHPERIFRQLHRYALFRRTYCCFVDALRSNSVRYLIQSVVEFLVFHDSLQK